MPGPQTLRCYLHVGGLRAFALARPGHAIVWVTTAGT
jgi:hypothetical protein